MNNINITLKYNELNKLIILCNIMITSYQLNILELEKQNPSNIGIDTRKDELTRNIESFTTIKNKLIESKLNAINEVKPNDYKEN